MPAIMKIALASTTTMLIAILAGRCTVSSTKVLPAARVIKVIRLETASA